MATGLDSKEMVSSDELLMSQVISQEAVIRLFVEKGILTEEACLKMMDVLSLEIAKIENTKKRLEAYDRASQPLDFHGGAERDRTVGLLNAIQALSQLSYSPTRTTKN